MITAEYRALAKDVASGNLPPFVPDRGWHKAFTYGFIAQAVSRIAIPSAVELLGSQEPHAVSTVTDLLAEHLYDQCNTMLADDPGLEYDVDWATSTRMRDIYDASIDEPGRSSLRAGVITAMDMERTTLATIQHRIQGGSSITMHGLLKSQRVPFAFAMQSLAAHDLYTGELFEWVMLPDEDGRPDSTKVLRPGAVGMTPDQGLTLLRDLPDEARYSLFGREPAIGCPATMVRHFIRDMHSVAARACVQAGIIPVIDN